MIFSLASYSMQTRIQIVIFLAFTTIMIDTFAANDSCPTDFCICSNDAVSCDGLFIKKAVQLLPNTIKTMKLRRCGASELDMAIFQNFSSLKHIQMLSCGISILRQPTGLTMQLKTIKILNLTGNEISDFSEAIKVLEMFIPNLTVLDLTDNLIRSIDFEPSSNNHHHLIRLIVAKNMIEKVGRLAKTIRLLDLSSNELVVESIQASRWPPKLHTLLLSQNSLTQFPTQLPSLLTSIHLDGNLIQYIQDGTLKSNARKMTDISLYNNPIRNFEQNLSNIKTMRNLQLSYTELRYFDIDLLRSGGRPRLSVNLSGNTKLVSIVGSVGGNIKALDLSKCNLRSLPNGFFQSVGSSVQLHLQHNPWFCSYCSLLWTRSMHFHLSICSAISNNTLFTQKMGFYNNTGKCTIGIDLSHPKDLTVRSLYGQQAILRCNQYGSPAPTITWYRYHPYVLIGSYEPENKTVINFHVSTDYEIIQGGQLLIRSASRSVVERYICIVSNVHGNRSGIVYLRLDLSSWYRLHPLRSVFLGSVVSGILTALAMFIINLLWLACRKLILWRINRAERSSRVRKMVEALEKYRQRQMMTLYERYTKQVNAMRDNYHNQLEQMRLSYASQAERFRDYTTAQLESVTAHLDTIRDNYNQQTGRMREYGARRADQLWEGYERQVNRIRAFSVQQRLRLMRQYEVKQRYLNKLLESLNLEQQTKTITRQDSEATTASIFGAPLDAAADFCISPHMQIPSTDLITFTSSCPSNNHQQQHESIREEEEEQEDDYRTSASSSYYSLPNAPDAASELCLQQPTTSYDQPNTVYFV